MVWNKIRFHYTDSCLKINNQIFIIYNLNSTCFWLVNQENGIGQCLHSKCQITAIFSFVDIGTDDYYVEVNASNVRYLAVNGHLKYHKTNNLRNLTIYNNILKKANFAPYKC